MGSEGEDQKADKGEEAVSADSNPATDRVRMNFWVRRDFYDSIAAQCKKQDITSTQFIKMALYHYLNHISGA